MGKVEEIMTTTHGFAPIRPGLLVTQIHQKLREAILDGTLRPGDALRDSVIAEQMKVSRSPVREALRLLEAAGLTTKDPNRSYVVLEFGEDDLRELAGMRLAYETLAVRLIVHSDKAVGDFSLQLKALRAALTSGSQAAIAAADRVFHSSLVALSGNSRLIEGYGRIQDQVELTLISTDAPNRGSDGMVERHELLVQLLTEAASRGQSGDVVAELESHILQGMGCPSLLPPLH
ncbi:DNA-binding GntR family transcriptional regulator [Arthrobacter sp. V4I6]|uniref:GntR family transcriptional regulator n=2 Tax=unclassified Arthrobacter TaxID=235627 RepID=UPI0027888B2C|nr:GntR family transcriptional regulator [Arthrobacter sp. V4I6]MDQ0821539.1 DNA-binding GntR family transcriptional regulator [Arthrobacter sp. V1I7]MDQ0855804.1 DNA-binding GntR family transcriptional regulator [Arthrobacter sp. V4I6]